MHVKVADRDSILNLLRKTSSTPSAGGENGEDEQKPNLTESVKNLLSMLGINKMKDVTPQPVRTVMGGVFSNVKMPFSYNEFNPDVFKTGLVNTLTGKDEPGWNEHLSSSGEGVKKMLTARDYINRAAFMSAGANRLGGASTFLSTGKKDKEGRDIMNFNSEGEYGKNMLEAVNRDAVSIMDYKLGHTMFNPDPNEENVSYNGVTKNQPMGFINYMNAERSHPIMGHYQLEPQGEGTDEKGYYVKYGGQDPWDFALHPGEKILNAENPKQGVKNLLRMLIDQFADPKTMEYQTKVYVPGVKKQPRERKRDVMPYAVPYAE